MEQQTSSKITSFEQLLAWQKAQDISVAIYRLTKTFPKEERFVLIDQIRRAANSISANIAEGFGRRTSRDKIQFYTIAYGSLLEAKNFLYLSEKLGYITPEDLDLILNSITDNQKLLNALMKSVRKNE